MGNYHIALVLGPASRSRCFLMDPRCHKIRQGTYITMAIGRASKYKLSLIGKRIKVHVSAVKSDKKCSVAVVDGFEGCTFNNPHVLLSSAPDVKPCYVKKAWDDMESKSVNETLSGIVSILKDGIWKTSL